MTKHIKPILIMRVFNFKGVSKFYVSGSVFNTITQKNVATLYFLVYQLYENYKQIEFVIKTLYQEEKLNYISDKMKSILDKEYNISIDIINFSNHTHNLKYKKEYYINPGENKK